MHTHKTVTQAIPTYTLSSFDIPVKNCDKLDSLSRRFWWKPKEKEEDSLPGKGGVSYVNQNV